MVGTPCEKCGRRKLIPYREKVVIRVVGCPMFGAEMHHHEQGRCRARVTAFAPRVRPRRPPSQNGEAPRLNVLR